MDRMEIDPELMYCPRCGDEYRADILTCAGCAVQLRRGRDILAAQTRSGYQAEVPLEIDPEESLVEVRRGPILQIKALQAHLLEAGLASLIGAENGGGCGCRGPEVILQVREQDLNAVMVVLAEEYRQSTGLAGHDIRFAAAVYDDQTEEALCPACGFRFSTRETACPDCGLCLG